MKNKYETSVIFRKRKRKYLFNCIYVLRVLFFKGFQNKILFTTTWTRYLINIVNEVFD